jgi:hypothetical protein
MNVSLHVSDSAHDYHILLAFYLIVLYMRILQTAIAATIFVESTLAQQDGGSVADQLRGLMSDSRFQSCEQDPANPTCQQVREEAEKKIVLQQNQIDQDVLTSRAYIDALRAELIQKVADLKHMNETIMGSMFAPGLLDQYAALTEGLKQLETMIDGSNAALSKEIGVRGNLYSSEMTRISSAQLNSANSAQQAMLRLANSNLVAQAAQIRAISNMFGNSLLDLAAQSSDLLTANDEQIADLDTQVTQATENAQAELSIIAEAASTAREDAKAVAAVGNATFKQAEQGLFKTAQAQVNIYKKYGDTLMMAARQDMNASLTDSIQQISDKIAALRSDLVSQFNENADAVFQNITKLKNSVSAIVPEALKRAEDLVDRATAKVSAAQQAASTSTESIKRLTSDTSKLLSDVSDQISLVSASRKDQQEQAAATLNQNIGDVKSKAMSQVASMQQGVQNELKVLSSQIGKTQASAAAKTQQAKDQYLAQLASVQSHASEASLGAVKAVSDASAASSSLGQLNQARLQQITATNSAKLNAVGTAVTSALQDARDATEEIGSQFAQQNRQLELSSGEMVASANAKNSQTMRDTAQSVDSSFADVQSSVLKTQQLSQAQMADLKTALSALFSGSDDVGSRAAALEEAMRSMTQEQLLEFQTLLNQINTSSALIDSTGQAAQAKLQAALQTRLAQLMQSLQSQLGSSSEFVSHNIEEATAAAKSTANKLADSQSELDGTFMRSSSDMSALLSTISGANIDVSASAASLETLLKSMTAQQLIDFEMKISQLRGDSKESETALLAYLSSLITNKTDAAKLDAESTFIKNEKALNEAIAAASEEIRKTKDLAAEALLNNEVVRANTSKLFDDFTNAEEKLANASETHSNVLQEIQQNITDWKADLVKRINDVQAQVAAGSAQLPAVAEEKLKNITLLISMNQDDLQSFLKQFQNSLDHAKAVQDSFEDAQAGRIISALTGVSQAITTASVRMASQVARSDMSATEKAKALTAVLSELCDSIDAANAQAGKDDDAIAAKVRAMGNNANSTLAEIADNVNSMMNGLATDKLKKDIGLAKTMEDAVTNAGVGINASANAIELAQAAIHRAVEKSSAGWAKNNKEAYTLGGFLFSLSQESQQKLLFILQQLQRGDLSMEQALAIARQADISKIKSAQDVVAVLVGAMDGYQTTVQSIFGNSFERLTNASTNLSSQVDAMASDLVTLASVLDYNSSMLANRVSKFTTISNDFINTTQTNVSSIESYIFDQQAQVTKAMSALSSLMDYSEKDVSLRQQQFSNWIDSLIANETSVVASKTQALKQALLGSKASSFAEIPDVEVAKKTLAVLRAEMAELDRRHKTHLRKTKQSTINLD